MGVCRVRHSQRLMEFLSAECQVRGNPVTLVKPAHDFSTQRHRLRGGRDSQPGLSYSNRAGSHTSPQDVGRQIRCAFCSAKWSKMMGFSGFRTRIVLLHHDTSLVVLNKTAIRLFFPFTFVRPLSLAKVRWLLEVVSLYTANSPYSTWWDPETSKRVRPYSVHVHVTPLCVHCLGT